MKNATANMQVTWGSGPHATWDHAPMQALAAAPCALAAGWLCFALFSPTYLAPQRPLIPIVLGINVAFDKVRGCLSRMLRRGWGGISH